jgi:ankyrin repeat protein
MQQTPSEQTMDVDTLFKLLASSSTGLASDLLDAYPGLVKTRLKDSRTMLMKAIAKKLPDLALLLIEKRADINAGKSGDTPLMLAMYFDLPDVAEKLLRLGAKVGPVNNKNRSAIDHLDQISDKAKKEVLKSLFESSQRLEAKKKRTGPLTPIELFNLLEKIPSTNSHMISTIIKKNKGSLDKYTGGGNTQLTIAVDRGMFVVVKKLIKHKADLNLAKLDGMTPLMLAVKKTNLKMVELLLDQPSCNIDILDKEGHDAGYFIDKVKWASDTVQVQVLDMFAAKKKKNQICPSVDKKTPVLVAPVQTPVPTLTEVKNDFPKMIKLRIQPGIYDSVDLDAYIKRLTELSNIAKEFSSVITIE